MTIRAPLCWQKIQFLYSRIKYIDIQHHYIKDEVSAGKIELIYVPITKMITYGLVKLLMHVKFHEFLEQMHIT